jgi:hypothetical protein
MAIFVSDQHPVKNQSPEKGKSKSKASRSLRDPEKPSTRFVQQSNENQ